MFAGSLLRIFSRITAAVVFACIALGDSLSEAASEAVESEGEQLLTQALAHTGNHEIKTGEFRYTVSAMTQPPTKEMIARRVEATRQSMLKRIEQLAGDKTAQRQFEEILETLEAETARQMVENAFTTTSVYFVLGGPKLGSDRYVEFSVVDRKSGKPRQANVVLQRLLGAGRGVSIFQKGSIGEAVANRMLMSPAAQEPQSLGRITGYLAQAAMSPGFQLKEHVSDVQVSIPDGQRNGDLRELTCRGESLGSGVDALKVRIDPSRGYITPLVQELDSVGSVVREWICDDFFQPRGTMLWFPRSCEYREGPPEAPVRSEKYQFSPDGVALNIAIPAERFAIAFHAGQGIADARDGDGSGRSYTANRNVQVTLDDLDRLSEMEAFELLVPNAAPKRASPLSYWLIAANVLVVCALLVWVMRRRRSQLASALILALVATSLSGQGRDEIGVFVNQL